MVDLSGTPYLLEAPASESLANALRASSDRIQLLRSAGKLNRRTLELYYGQTRIEQVAESNAIEGSTLSVGETELAVLKGVTLTGHNPRWSHDARQLDLALRRLVEMARAPSPTNLTEVKEIHGLIVSGGGAFRREPVRIAGSRHRPPETWARLMSDMESWERWSLGNPSVHAVLRGAVLHAWLAHIHPFVDGNGRTARAMSNLELVRAGFPPIIIKRSKHRDRYLDALAASDEGDLGPFVDLVLVRLDDALRDVERAAALGQGYDKQAQLLRTRQEARLTVWNAAVELLAAMIASELEQRLASVGGDWNVKRYRDSLTLDDFILLCQGGSVPDAWSFLVRCSAPGLNPVERLAYIGFRSESARRALPKDAASGPSLFWSMRNDQRYPPWRRAGQSSPGGEELTLVDDTWHVRRHGRVQPMRPGQAAAAVASDLVEALT